MTFKSILLFIILIPVFFLVSCAKQGSPAGGPKDEDPPVVLSEFPPNRTVNFNFPRFTVTFDEFISLKDPAKEIFIAPPMRTRPVYKAAGKKLIVEFSEELKENATYTVNFGNSIVDYTEGNPLVNYEYVFSTGENLDSLSLSGKILNAFDHKPETGIIMMVYQDDNDTIPLDSLPFKVPPKNASRTTKDGAFRINNLPGGKYKLFALEDLNNNFIFDLPNEKTAFIDSLVSLEPPLVPEIMPVDSADSTSAFIASETIAEKSYTLYLFTEADTVQRLMSKKLTGRNMLQYIFKLPVDSVEIFPVDLQTGRPDWQITEYGVKRDTVNFWLKPGLPDTIRVAVHAGESVTDTSKYILSRSSAGLDIKTRKKDNVAAGMPIFSRVFAGAFDLNKEFTLTFPQPIDDFDPYRIHLYTLTDTLIPAFYLTDSIKRHGIIDYKWKPGEFYHILIEDSVFRNLEGAYNDSTSFRFKVRTPEDYGVLLLDLVVPEPSGDLIVQLMTDKEILLNQKILQGSGSVRFEFLMPGNYKLKVIFDDNSNGKWDTGKYSAKSLPERIEYYSAGITIRSNWELQEEWQIDQ